MTNEITMPLWGPYSKKYMGLSRIIEKKADDGVRMDFIVHPTLWNSSTPVPNVTFPSNYHLWNANADFSFYSYRYELMWKDKIYADVSWSKINNESYLMRCQFNNNTELSQNIILNMFASLEYPFMTYCDVKTPKKYILINANDYIEYSYKNPRPWDNENPDGMKKGQFADPTFYTSFGLGDRCENYHVDYLNLKSFGCEKDDKVSFSISSKDFKNPILAVRYKTVTDNDVKFTLNSQEITFKKSNDLTFSYFDYDSEMAEFISLGTGGIELDFLAVIEKDEKEMLTATVKDRDVTPEINSEKTENGLLITLYYKDTDETYYVLTSNKKTRLRTLESGCLEDALINRLSNGDPTYDRLKETFSNSFKEKKSDDGFFQNTVIPSIFVAPNTTHTEYIIVSKNKPQIISKDECESIYENAKMASTSLSYNKEGKKYALSTEILKSTLLTNIVYPVYKHGKNVSHYTPGKRWDSFYTWDSGIIGTGVLEFSKEKSEYILQTYLSDDDNKDFAFLLHGSLVPTQFPQYLELLKRAENKESLFDLYPKMKRYYEYISGKTLGSTCGKFKNGLTTTYDYWYSCSGMDDYPAQVAMVKEDKKQYLCPCISTSHTIRAAKILKMVASALNLSNDIAEYDNDIEKMANALNKYSWDENSGYYAYTVYDDDKNYQGIYKTSDGENWDKGMDGVYPIVAGVAPKDRREKVLAHIKNPNEMWSKAGISAVDMSASYYFDDGYWNGNVWMSHQWFLWKTMFDLGEADFAFEIAKRALDMWKDETDFTYNTYECFGIQTKRGGWFHNFGGLSAPINIWANAYYKPQTVTTGFDVWTNSQKVTNDSAKIDFKYFGNNEKYVILVTLSDEYSYKAFVNSKEVELKSHANGSVEIELDGSVKSGVLTVEKR